MPENESARLPRSRPALLAGGAWPLIQQPTDAIVRVDAVTICGTDLHILKGDVPTCEPGRILGHEAAGTVVETGDAVTGLRAGDRVLVSGITGCGRCRYCRTGSYGQLPRRRRLDPRSPRRRRPSRVRPRAVRRDLHPPGARRSER
ncbi:alcohol dehydrogenase catalytic domain-containing protein [Nonomuraea sp. NPDC050310]|uniref:alcohol dehydrogenase catalytic domain-containing protein n=1 Tax=Nonomuraea sp. NPDC050310 TaxID=3154935 RepID=UPI0033F65F13